MKIVHALIITSLVALLVFLTGQVVVHADSPTSNNVPIAYDPSTGIIANSSTTRPFIFPANTLRSGSYSVATTGTTTANGVTITLTGSGPVINGTSVTITGTISASQVSGLATVATTGAYNDLVGKPTIVTTGSSASPGLTLTVSGTNVILGGTSTTITGTIPASQVNGLATVATTGTYNDLAGKPTIVTTGSSTSPGLTLTISGTNVILGGTATSFSGTIPASQVSGLAASGTIDTTNASNLSSGTVSMARLPIGSGSNAIPAGNSNLLGTIIPSFTPLISWYEASDLTTSEGALVTTWPDRSGNGWTATKSGAGTATMEYGGFNGQPAVNCGVAYFNTGTSTLSGSYSGYTVVMALQCMSGTSINSAPYRTGTFPFAGQLGILASPTLTSTNAPSNSQLLWQVYNSVFTQQAITGKKRRDLNQVMIVIASYDNAGSRASLWIDGFDQGDVSMGGSVDTVTGRIWFGNTLSDATFSCKIGMCATFGRVLTDSEKKRLSAELVARYETDRQNRIVLIGPSVLNGMQASQGLTPAERLQAVLPSYRVVDATVSGSGVLAFSGTSLPGAQLVNSLRENDVVLAYVGDADFINGTSEATVQAGAVSLIGKIHARKAKVVLSTLMPFYVSGSAAQATAETSRGTYNTWILSNTSGADVVVDPTQSIYFNSGTASLSGSGYADAPNGVHPSDTGYGDIINIWEAGVRKAAGLSPRTVYLSGTFSSGSCSISDASINYSPSTYAISTGSNAGPFRVTISGTTATVISSDTTTAGTVKVVVPVGN